MSAALFTVFAVAMVLGVPVAIVMGGASLAAILWDGRYPGLILAQRMFSGIDSFPLMAVPFFVLAAELMTGGRITDSLLALARQIIGRLRGGLGHANILMSVFFSGISGSALADAAGPGAVTIQMMRSGGYKPEYAAALTASSAIISSIIPPSIVMVIYALTDNAVSVSALFIAGIVPGALIGLSLVATNAYLSWRRGFALDEPRKPWLQFFRESGVVLSAIPLPVIIIGGIHSGAFTPTEASAVAAVYAFVVAKFVLRSLAWRQLPYLFARASLMTSAVLMIVATASAFAWLLTVLQLPQTIAGFIAGFGLPNMLLLLVMAIFLLLCGLFIDTLPGVLLFTPIVAPIADMAGIHPIQTALVVILSLTIGMITPPVGGVLFVVSVVSRIPLMRIVATIGPFLLAELLVLLLLVFVPAASLWLPGLFGYVR
ncbi:TRAP transporter large permease [Chelativorans salis]|uniref:TRAP transporter large permease protein n=1 Tax=Chelativorans salis TaxID=2978478 RepID=A0ABT2LTF4_9HYPH|nr:TRAP transporter large permease [Chelativorans sp. EGI FJ00035]MCT7376653.1 TRAP transporter large permease [Chelativorans sp. EGI FJ00035]